MKTEPGIKRNNRLITSPARDAGAGQGLQNCKPPVEGGGVFVGKSLQDLASSTRNCVCAARCVHNLFRMGSGAGKERLRRGEQKVGEEREKDP